MSFRKRNVALTGPPPIPKPNLPKSPTSTSTSTSSSSTIPPPSIHTSAPAIGIRPSPLDGRPTTSTGTLSLDDLLAGHAGLALGNSLLIEESGTTDFASTLLRCYAGEGVLQGQKVHVVGVGELWGRDLPGVVILQGGGEKREGGGEKEGEEKGRMKIAWRYEKLGEFGNGPRASPIQNRSLPSSLTSNPDLAPPQLFCHSFDLTKRLAIPPSNPINFLPITVVNQDTSPFITIIQIITRQLSSTPQSTIHRLIIPALLSPAFYPQHASDPQHVLQFLHALRALLRLHPMRLTAMLTLPLTLYPRFTGLVRWMELLSDGVVELAPFPYSAETGPLLTTSGAATAQEEKPHGMVKVHRLPVFHEKGGGGGGQSIGIGGDDLAFTVSRRRFAIKPFSLPPVEGNSEGQMSEGELGVTKVDIEF